jgi:phage baseplate assembly protein gpV
MNSARENATATLLKNGKVLVAGGDAHPAMTYTYYASAEIYDPATGKFTITGSMTAARADATAILLADGRVLVAGGDGCSDPKHCTNIQAGAIENLVSADIYDPATGKFTRTGSMTGIALTSAAVLLPDGKVLMAAFEPDAELYSPSTGKFTSNGTGTASSPPTTATTLLNGKVLVTAQEGAPQLYDVATGKFTKVSLALPPGTPVAKYQGAIINRTTPYTATLLKDGRVLLFADGSLETYDPATGACADAGFISPGDNWDSATATLMPDGRVLFVGGGLAYGAKTAVLYDPVGGPSRTTDSALAALGGQTATLLPDGSVLIAGGQDSNSKFLASAELFKP